MCPSLFALVFPKKIYVGIEKSVDILDSIEKRAVVAVVAVVQPQITRTSIFQKTRSLPSTTSAGVDYLESSLMHQLSAILKTDRKH